MLTFPIALSQRSLFYWFLPSLWTFSPRYFFEDATFIFYFAICMSTQILFPCSPTRSWSFQTSTSKSTQIWELKYFLPMCIFSLFWLPNCKPKMLVLVFKKLFIFLDLNPHWLTPSVSSCIACERGNNNLVFVWHVLCWARFRHAIISKPARSLETLAREIYGLYVPYFNTDLHKVANSTWDIFLSLRKFGSLNHKKIKG